MAIKMKGKYSFWLKVLGYALLIMILNVAVSIVEVYIFSRFIPGRPKAFYDAHARISAPWVAGIVGGLLMFWFTRRYIKTHSQRRLTFTIALPTAYAVVDLGILIAMHTDFSETYPIIILAALAKYTGSALAFFIKPLKKHERLHTPGGVF